MEDILNLDQIKHGEVFAFATKTWIGFESKEMPPEMKGIISWRFLRADGRFFHKDRSMAEAWQRSRSSVACIVGYWYAGAENRAPTKPVEAETFELLGHTWTRCRNDKMPAELAGVKANDWQYLTEHGWKEGIIGWPLSDADKPNNYWRGYSGGIIAYRILSKPPVVKRKEPADEHQGLCNEVGVPTKIYDQGKPVRPLASLEEIQATTAMVERDGVPETAEQKPEKLIKAMVGNGNIFAPPKRTVHPLFRVTPMTTTGHVLWGAEHLPE